MLCVALPQPHAGAYSTGASDSDHLCFTIDAVYVMARDLCANGAREGTAPGIAFDWALAQVGTLCVWGGESRASAPTDPGLARPPTPRSGSRCRGSPRTTRRPSSARMIRWSRAISCSSAAVRLTSLTSAVMPASRTARRRWSTLPRRRRTCGSRRSRAPPVLLRAPRSTLGQPRRFDEVTLVSEPRVEARPGAVLHGAVSEQFP